MRGGTPFSLVATTLLVAGCGGAATTPIRHHAGTRAPLPLTFAPAVPVSIALNPDDSAFVVTVAADEFVVPLEETSEESSHRHAAQLRPLRRLQQLAQRVEAETKGMARKLAEKFKQHQIFVYEADHGFNCDQRGSYNAPAAKQARERTLAFFRKHVG